MPESTQYLNYTWGGSLKSVDEQGILEGDAIVFGSEKSPDISSFKDFFDINTYVHPEEKFTTPLYMEHGYSYRKPIGKAVMVKTDKGWTATAELDMSNPVVKSRFPEIKSGGWGFSTGAVGHVVEREPRENGTHFISQWSVGELSITRTPAEPKALIHTVKSLDEYYQAFQEDLPEESDNSTIEANMMKIIEMLILELTKKSTEEIVFPLFEEIKSELAELKSASLPIGTDSSLFNDDEIEEKLTVLKSENEELKSSIEELQSSFNEKEALLSEKMALLSEIQEQLDKSEETENPLISLELMKNKWKSDFEVLENKQTNAEKEIEKLKKDLDTAKKINLTLGKKNFNK